MQLNTLNLIKLNFEVPLISNSKEIKKKDSVDNWQWDDGKFLLWDDNSLILI